MDIEGGGLATHHSEANKEARLVERNIYFILDASMWWAGGGWAPVQRLTASSLDNEWTRPFTDRGRGLCVETAESAMTVILKLVIGGLTSVILIVLIIVTVQFQG